jgi:Zn-dependent protease
MQIDQAWLVERLYILIPLWISLSVHECAHAWSAWRLGDDTAEKMGRLTLNPLAHIDPIGTLLLPLLGVPFGWAKPVPVDPTRFTHKVSMRNGMMLTAIAGPISNLCLSAASIVMLALMIHFQLWNVPAWEGAFKFFQMMMVLNVVLAVFNILPIPPLDGSRVADALMPDALRPAWTGFCRIGPIALIAVIFLPKYSGIDLFHWPLMAALSVVQELVILLGR